MKKTKKENMLKNEFDKNYQELCEINCSLDGLYFALSAFTYKEISLLLEKAINEDNISFAYLIKKAFNDEDNKWAKDFANRILNNENISECKYVDKRLFVRLLDNLSISNEEKTIAIKTILNHFHEIVVSDEDLIELSDMIEVYNTFEILTEANQCIKKRIKN